MQSGISASQELQDAFNGLVSSSGQRAVLAGIENERLVPRETVSVQSSDFLSDLPQLDPLLQPNAAAYVLLKTHPDAADGYAAITFVPNAAPVRQKMLFASTRLTLVRELGIERFRQTIFATEKTELTAEGWAKHEAHEKQAAPLTEEESLLGGVKDAEARESQGTGARRGHVSSRVDVKTGEGVLEALGSLKEEDCKGTLVQLKYVLPDETLQLESSADGVEPGQVSAAISTTEPRYTFYLHPRAPGATPAILFIYTCPSGSKIKERMIYSTGKSWTRTVAERDAGLQIAKSLEATEPDELTAEVLDAGMGAAAPSEESSRSATPSAGASGGFARPKRPGRR